MSEDDFVKAWLERQLPLVNAQFTADPGLTSIKLPFPTTEDDTVGIMVEFFLKPAEAATPEMKDERTMPNIYAFDPDSAAYVISDRAGTYVKAVGDAYEFTKDRAKAARFDRPSAIIQPIVRAGHKPPFYFDAANPTNKDK